MNEVTIDIHGMTVDMARREIERLIAQSDNTVKRVIVIHGYHKGNALKQLVQSPSGLRSKRIKRRVYSMNQGETVLELY